MQGVYFGNHVEVDKANITTIGSGNSKSRANRYLRAVPHQQLQINTFVVLTTQSLLAISVRLQIHSSKQIKHPLNISNEKIHLCLKRCLGQVLIAGTSGQS
ncbi:Hypothetical_protein [Hexamita inflata]|uniref:Hypothetical_protein n=1 Tax=Hexamita inflata TaxID=28002 RepID=A0AA86PSB6_9EUKA|nr:Hypothetical protein HINF_LOCUS30263 [Hexamita inflata]